MTKYCWILAGVLMLGGCGGCQRQESAPPSAPSGQAAAPPTNPPPPPAEQAMPAQDEDDCIVIIDANPDYGPPPLAVAFSAEAECSNGEIKYQWDFGDGSTSAEPNPSHTYTKVGDYVATLTVTAGKAEATDEYDITVEEGDEEDVAGD